MKADYLFLGLIIAREAIKHASAIFNYSIEHTGLLCPAVLSPLNNTSSHSSTGDSNEKTDVEDGEEVSPLHNFPPLRRGVAALAKSHQ